MSQVVLLRQPDTAVVRKINTAKLGDRADSFAIDVLHHTLHTEGQDSFEQRAQICMCRIAGVVACECGIETAKDLLRLALAGLESIDE